MNANWMATEQLVHDRVSDLRRTAHVERQARMLRRAAAEGRIAQRQPFRPFEWLRVARLPRLAH